MRVLVLAYLGSGGRSGAHPAGIYRPGLCVGAGSKFVAPAKKATGERLAAFAADLRAQRQNGIL